MCSWQEELLLSILFSHFRPSEHSAVPDLHQALSSSVSLTVASGALNHPLPSAALSRDLNRITHHVTWPKRTLGFPVGSQGELRLWTRPDGSGSLKGRVGQTLGALGLRTQTLTYPKERSGFSRAFGDPVFSKLLRKSGAFGSHLDWLPGAELKYSAT